MTSLINIWYTSDITIDDVNHFYEPKQKEQTMTYLTFTKEKQNLMNDYFIANAGGRKYHQITKAKVIAKAEAYADEIIAKNAAKNAEKETAEMARQKRLAMPAQRHYDGVKLNTPLIVERSQANAIKVKQHNKAIRNYAKVMSNGWLKTYRDFYLDSADGNMAWYCNDERREMLERVRHSDGTIRTRKITGEFKVNQAGLEAMLGIAPTMVKMPY